MDFQGLYVCDVKSTTDPGFGGLGPSDLAAYEAVANIDGVEQATASFKDGRVTALIDPTKTDRAKLEDALKKKGEFLP